MQSIINLGSYPFLSNITYDFKRPSENLQMIPTLTSVVFVQLENSLFDKLTLWKIIMYFREVWLLLSVSFVDWAHCYHSLWRHFYLFLLTLFLIIRSTTVALQLLSQVITIVSLFKVNKLISLFYFYCCLCCLT